MTSKAERITAAIAAALTVPAMTSVPAARVYRDLHGALQADLLPAVAIETGDEPEPSHRANGYKVRFVDVRVTVVAKGASPYTAADAALVESHARVMADRTLGGLAIGIDEGQTRRERGEAEEQLGAITKTYRVQYYTTETSIE